MFDAPNCWRLHLKVLALEGGAVVFLLIYLATRKPFGLFLESPDLRPILGVVLLFCAVGDAAASTLLVALLAQRLGPGWAILVSRLAALAGVVIAIAVFLVA